MCNDGQPHRVMKSLDNCGLGRKTEGADNDETVRERTVVSNVGLATVDKPWYTHLMMAFEKPENNGKIIMELEEGERTAHPLSAQPGKVDAP